jgi:hypothetical protein
MLRKISNPENKPVFLFYHRGELYYGVGGEHHRFLQAASIATSHLAFDELNDRTQAFIFDPHQAKLSGIKDRDWFIVECERKGTRFWDAAPNEKWITERTEQRTLDVLRRDDNHDLIVASTHKEVVEDLKESKKRNYNPDEPRSNASSGLPAEREDVSVEARDEDPKPKRQREEKCGCTDKCFCDAGARSCETGALAAEPEQHSFSDTTPCKLCEAPMCLK